MKIKALLLSVAVVATMFAGYGQKQEQTTAMKLNLLSRWMQNLQLLKNKK